MLVFVGGGIGMLGMSWLGNMCGGIVLSLLNALCSFYMGVLGAGGLVGGCLGGPGGASWVEVVVLDACVVFGSAGWA